MAYLQDEANGLSQTQNDAGFRIIATYRPAQLIAKQQMIGQNVPEFDSLSKFYSMYTYFIIEISKDDEDLETTFAKEGNDLAMRVGFLSSSFSKNFHIKIGQDVRPIADFIYVRSYGVSASRFLVVFDSVDLEDFRLVVDGRDLGFGQVNFDFDESKIKRIPRLHL